MNVKPVYLLAVVLMLGCSTTKKVVVVKPETKTVLSETALQGQTLYENNCKRCHRLYNASEFTAARWPSILDSMQKKAKITDQQKELISEYLAVNSKK